MSFFILVFYENRCYRDKLEEYFSNAALNQLFSKGPEDSYLTHDTDKYVPEYTPGLFPWRYYLWNAPTRIGTDFANPYGIFPYYNSYPVYRN
jgi:hypothetical protein